MTRNEAIEILNNTSFFAPSMAEVDEAIDMAIEALERPTADLVEVVRCKDCYWYIINELKADGTEDKRYKPSRCSFFNISSREDDYCSFFGERNILPKQ